MRRRALRDGDGVRYVEVQRDRRSTIGQRVVALAAAMLGEVVGEQQRRPVDVQVPV